MTLAVLGDFGDALRFIFQARPSPAGGGVIGGAHNLELIAQHLQLSAVAMVLALVVALPVGLYLGHTGRGSFLAISIANVGRAVPSLALIFFAIAFFPHTPEFVSVTVALALLAVPPIVTNTYVGVRQIDRDAIEAARGMGLSGRQVMRSIELPLALPLIFGGVKTSTVNVIATATIAPLAGVESLGDPIGSPTVYGRPGQIGASIIVAALAVLAEVGLSAVQRAVTPRGVRLERGSGAVGRRPHIPSSQRRVRTAP